MESKGTLTDIVGRDMLPFEVDGKTFYIRQPTPDEYDDAESLKSLVYQRTLAEEYVQEVADVPCSPGERAMFELVIKDTQERFDRLGDVENAALKDQLAQEIARLQNSVETRTLAQEYASDKSTLVRDRWLTMRLLCDENGKAMFNVKAKDFEARWIKLALKVKDAARPCIWQALSLVREAPFS